MLTYPNLKYVSGDFTEAKAVSLPAFSAPFADLGVNIFYVLNQDFMQDVNHFAPLALGTAHPDYPDYKLVRESEHQAMSGGRIRWTRTYAKLPASFSRTGGKYPYLFPAFVTGSGLTNRNAKTITVGLRTQYDFARTADPLTDLPIVKAQRYVLAGNADVDAVNGSEPAVVSNTLPGVSFTVPSYQDYKTWINNGTEIVPEAAAPEVWMGDIYWRRTLYIPAT